MSRWQLSEQNFEYLTVRGRFSQKNKSSHVSRKIAQSVATPQLWHHYRPLACNSLAGRRSSAFIQQAARARQIAYNPIVIAVHQKQLSRLKHTSLVTTLSLSSRSYSPVLQSLLGAELPANRCMKNKLLGIASQSVLKSLLETFVLRSIKPSGRLVIRCPKQ